MSSPLRLSICERPHKRWRPIIAPHKANYSAAELLARLDSKGLVTADHQDLADFVVRQQQEKELPLYLRALVGVGAFIASFCFIGFLAAADLIDFDHKGGLIVWGLFFVASAIGLQRRARHSTLVQHSFLMQSSFASMAVGKALFVLGISEFLDSGWGATLGLLIITILTYNIYRMSIDRFLSSFAVLFSFLANILWDEDVGGSRELLLNSFFLLQFAGTAILLTHGKIKRDYIPLSYAFAFSLCATVLFLASYTKFSYWMHQEHIHPMFINIVLACGLVALFGWVAGSKEKLKTKPLILASAGAVLLGFISAPGIVLALGFMILGYAKHEELLTIAGTLLLPVFLWLYYYNLDISLLGKSAVLIGSGAVLLAGHFYLKHKGWDKGDLSCVQK